MHRTTPIRRDPSRLVRVRRRRQRWRQRSQCRLLYFVVVVVTSSLLWVGLLVTTAVVADTTEEAATATIESASFRPADDKNRWIATVEFTMPEDPTGNDEASTVTGTRPPAPFKACYTVPDDDDGVAIQTRARRQVLCVQGHVTSTVLLLGDDGTQHDDDQLGRAAQDDAATVHGSDSEQAHVGEDKDLHGSSIVRVGDKVYQPPFNQYGSSDVLRLHLASFADAPRLHGNDPADHADWLMVLGDLFLDESDYDQDSSESDDRDSASSMRSGGRGASRRRDVTRRSASATTTTATAASSRSGSKLWPPAMHSFSKRAQNVEHAVNAYKQAIKILGMIVRSAGKPINAAATDVGMANYVMDAKFQLANAYFAISDAYAGISGPSHRYDDDEVVQDVDLMSDATTRPRHHNLAVAYMKLAEVLYRRILAEANDWLDEPSIKTAQLARAVCCARLGVLMLEDPKLDDSLHRITSGGGGIDDDPSQSVAADAATEEASVASLTRQYYQDMANQGEYAMGYFLEAETFYRDAVTSGSGSSTASGHPSGAALEYDYATVLHNLATASTYRGRDYETTVRYGTIAIRHYQAVLERHSRGSTGALEDPELNLDGLPSAVGELMLLVSDSYLKLGRYDECKAYYVQCMAWYERFELSAPPSSTGTMMMGAGGGGIGGADGSASEAVGTAIEEYEQTLDEYKALLQEQAGGFAGGGDDEGGVLDVEPQEGYEGDLHMNLGSLYLAHGDIFTAISHLQQAASLYERSDEKGDVANVADVKFTLAELHFRNGDFPSSILLHGQAVDLYRSTEGVGAIPMDEGIPHVQPTVTFVLDPIDGVADLEVDPTDHHRQASVASRQGSPVDPVPKGAASTQVRADKAQDASSSDHRGGKAKADPVLAMMDFWYAALANDTEDASTSSPPPKEAAKDEL